MKHLALIVTLIALLAGCATQQEVSPLQPLHDDLLSKFTPVLQIEDEIINHSGNVPFSGDCDDYYTAAWNRLLAAEIKPTAVLGFSESGQYHVMACATRIDKSLECLDPNSKKITPFHRVKEKYSKIQIVDY